MATDTLRQRKPAQVDPIDDPIVLGKVLEHPGGDVKHGGPKELLRFLLVVIYFMSSCFSYVHTYSMSLSSS